MFKIYVVVIAVLSISIYSYANEVKPYKRHSLILLWENDFLNFMRSDRYYSNGVRLGYYSKEYDYSIENNAFSWGKNISITSYKKPHITRYHISLNQEMYTPSGHGPTIAKNDHPHGSFLYINTGIFNRTYNTLEHIGIKTGITGPYTFAGQLHTYVHKSSGQMVFKEWKREVDTEFIFNPYYQWTGRAYIFKTNYISMDFLGTFDTALGNADTHFGVQGSFRIGYNLDNDFGIERMTLSNDGPSVHSDKFSAYIFFGGGGRVVLHNLFVTGNSDITRKGYNINLLRGEASCGIVISYYGVRIGYSWSYYTSDYVQQIHNHHAIGSLFGEISF